MAVKYNVSIWGLICPSIKQPEQSVCHFNHCWRRKMMWSRAIVSCGRSSLLAGYMLAQWAVPEQGKYINIWSLEKETADSLSYKQ